jgi:hypothetical protein
MASSALTIISTWILTGVAFGLLSTIYGACRAVYRIWPGLREFLDWFWFVVAAVVYLLVIFWSEWGVFRIWSLLFLLLGFLVWNGLGAPWAFPLLVAIARRQARLVHYALWPGVRAVRAVRYYFRRRQKPKDPPNA